MPCNVDIFTYIRVINEDSGAIIYILMTGADLFKKVHICMVKQKAFIVTKQAILKLLF
jgi:hypothetical protein